MNCGSCGKPLSFERTSRVLHVAKCCGRTYSHLKFIKGIDSDKPDHCDENTIKIAEKGTGSPKHFTGAIW